MSDTIAHRDKRFIIPLAFLVITLTGATTGIYSVTQAEKNKGQNTALNTVMCSLVSTMKTLDENNWILETNQQQVLEYVSDHFVEIYGMIETMRCTHVARLTQVQLQTNMHLYERSLEKSFNAIVYTATIGKITPCLLGVNKLKTVLNKDPAMQN